MIKLLLKLLKIKVEEPKVTCSLDYFEQLEQHVKLLEGRVQKLEAKAQLKLSGELKVLEPVAKPERKKKVFLSVFQRNDIVQIYKSGTNAETIAKRFNVHPTTIYNIVKEA